MKTRSSTELFLLSMLYFFIAKIIIKLIPRIPSYEIIFFRTLISVFMCYFVIQKKNIPMFGTNRKDLMYRGIFGSLGMLTFFYSLQHLPLITATALICLSPIFTILFASVILKEKTKSLDWLLSVFAFIGVLMLKGIDTTITLKNFIIGISSAVFSSIAMNFIRRIREKEDPHVIVFSLSFIALPIIFPLMIWQWKTPTPLEWFLLMIICVLIQFAQLYLTKAHQTAHTTSSIVHYAYLDVVASAIVGTLVFHETFTIKTLISILIILGSVYAIHLSHKKVTSKV